MTWDQLLESTAIIPADFFIVKKEEISVAAAVVFHVANQIVQVIYWGDLPQYAEFKTMNFLSFQVFQYYTKQGISIIDIGPSTEDSVPNNGLCEFKESIGCDISIKTEFFKKLN
jgi:lipid II:glycine glycyltransferase (peptidoglycan interpeptide bridge formation enzyme)